MQVNGIALRLIGPAEAAQTFHQLHHALDREVVHLHDPVQSANHTPQLGQLGLVDVFVFQDRLQPIQCPAQHIVIAVQRAERRIELVGDPGDQRTERGQLGGVDQFRLRRYQPVVLFFTLRTSRPKLGIEPRNLGVKISFADHMNAWISFLRMPYSSWCAFSSALTRASSSLNSAERSTPFRITSFR